MKRVITLIAFTVLFAFSFFAQELDLSQLKPGKTDLPAMQNHSYLTEEAVGSTIEVKGLLSVNKNSFVLKENPTSKSVVTFKLEVKKASLKRKLKKLDGQTVKITGVLTEASSTWNKKMKVLSVE
jgi:hypothetical protein